MKSQNLRPAIFNKDVTDKKHEIGGIHPFLTSPNFPCECADSYSYFESEKKTIDKKLLLLSVINYPQTEKCYIFPIQFSRRSNHYNASKLDYTNRP